MAAVSQMEPREAALCVAQHLIKHGHLAYFAGGCVRDRLLGLSPGDYDVATDADPARVQSIFSHARGVGEAFGVMLVSQGGQTVEVATFRSDGAYIDHRHPTEVAFGTPEEDAQRRDFTINGLFEDPQTGEIIDFVEGQKDLNLGVLRAIGDPAARLDEDHLRMLRAARFAARFGFAIDEATTEAIKERAGNLKGISKERIGNELRRMFSDANRVKAARLIESLGLDTITLGTRRDSDLTRLGALPTSSPWVDALGAWLLDRGETISTVDLAQRLVLSNQERNELAGVLEMRPAAWFTLSVAQKKRLAANPLFKRSLAVLATEDEEHAAKVAQDLKPLEEEGLAPERLLTGGTLLEAGFSEGPQLGMILEAVYDAQLEGRVTSAEEAMAMAETMRAQEG
jgi:poly(A) polymerase